MGFIPAWAGNTSKSPQQHRYRSVHPRVGGEHHCQPPRVARNAGSSPRGRGTLTIPPGPIRQERFIPAWAGNTSSSERRSARSSVHPRVGGEHARAAPIPTPTSGSSPRGRGTRMTDRCSTSGTRFIPAWAGNTSHPSIRITAPTVHPRVGGEHCLVFKIEIAQNGSSPRGRGTLFHGGGADLARRFIPAWAGNTRCRPSRSARRAVHPRVGGEHTHTTMTSRAARGSSPRGRGTRYFSRQDADRNRFIPAWAGNTRQLPPASTYAAVHPRVGGEHADAGQDGGTGHGSSPRGRGTRLRNASDEAMVRFIPAWAGNTVAPLSAAFPPPVHPRVGGEHAGPRALTRCPAGSSPRGRGTRRSAGSN